MPNPNQEPPDPTKAPNQDFKDMDVLCTFKIKIGSQDLEHGSNRNQWPYSNQDQDTKPQSRTSSILQSPKSRLKGHGCSLYLQNQGREPKFGSWVYQRPVTISKSISRCQAKSKIFSILQIPKSWLEGHECSLNFQNQDREPKFWSLVYQRPVTTSQSRSKCKNPARSL